MLDVEGLGTHRVSMSGGRARVDEARTRGRPDFRLQTDARTLVELVTGTTGRSA